MKAFARMLPGTLIGILLGSGALAQTTLLTLRLRGSRPIQRSTVRYRCDAQGVRIGLPSGVFAVEYLNGAGNHLAVVPVHGRLLVFANVISGSGARYASAQYIWWTGRENSFSTEGIGGTQRSICQQVNAK